MSKNQTFKTFQQQLSTLTYEQTELLFFVCKKLNLDHNFFMSEESHMNFMIDLIELPCNRNPLTFKTFITYAIPKYTSESKHPDLLKTIEMITHNVPLDDILTTLLNER